jgi:arylsulfatase A-like enzyme
MKTTTFILMSLIAALLATVAPADAANPTRPNIILIMSDDMGFSDAGCYGGEIATPNLDLMARGGVRFTQFYNTARCCPTRASLLTGLYPHQAGIGHMMDDRGLDGYRGDLNDRCVTIAEVLKPAGYRTYMAGKWHVTKKVRPSGEAEKHNWPLQRGFDRFYGTIHGAGSFFDPNSLTRDNTLISPYADPEYQPAGVLLHRCDQRPRRAVHRRPCPRSQRAAVFHVRGAHRAALADARQAGGHRKVPRASTTRATTRSERRASSGCERWG